MQEGTVLCFDFGLARIGVASGNTLTRSAQPVTIIHARTNDERWKAVEARQLGGRFRLPVRTVDERFSSVMVEHGADKIDDEAAAVILQQYFDEQDAVA